MRIFACDPTSSSVPLVFEGSPGSMERHQECPERLVRLREGFRSYPSITTVSDEVTDLQLKSVHDAGMIDFLREMERTDRSVRPLFPDSFPEQPCVPPLALRGQFGFYCTDTQTPFRDHYWKDALRAARCSLDAADALVAGERTVYSACRPPGHHAGRSFFGGFCYLNNTALAARSLANHGSVAVLDVDYHHGNGTQDCFYRSDAVFTVSVHADTRYQYPFFSGHPEERGEGQGTGYNLNLPVSLDGDAEEWFAGLDAGLEAIAAHDPDFLVLAFGADTYRGDPVGGLSLDIEDYREIGRRVAAAGHPTLVVQEGGYALDALAQAVSSLLAGLESP